MTPEPPPAEESLNAARSQGQRVTSQWIYSAPLTPNPMDVPTNSGLDSHARVIPMGYEVKINRKEQKIQTVLGRTESKLSRCGGGGDPRWLIRFRAGEGGGHVRESYCGRSSAGDE